jgi:hypothetical protein
MKKQHLSRLGAALATILLAALLAAFPAAARQQAPQQPSQDQQPSPPPQKPAANPPAAPQSQPAQQPGQKPGEKAAPDSENKSGTSNDRLFFALPNFLTLENAGQVPPLTAGQKFKVITRSSFDYVEWPYYAVLAGISQAENSDKGYGQGASGYGKRYGAAFADGTIENFMTGAVFPSLLREDPRYYQLGKGGFWHRAGYAVGRVFVIRTDSGHNSFNFSEIFGSAMAAGISTYSYHPGNERTISNAGVVWGSQVGQDVGSFMLKEFWPDIRRKLKKQ